MSPLEHTFLFFAHRSVLYVYYNIHYSMHCQHYDCKKVHWSVYFIKRRVKVLIKVHLSRLLGERKMKISDLSNATGLHRNGLSKLYKEETDGVKFETLEKVCKALDCKIEDLLEIVED